MSAMYLNDIGIDLRNSVHKCESGRITHQQMLTMKSLAQRKQKKGVLLTVRQITKRALASLFQSPLWADKPPPMCRNYGHVIKDIHWKGSLPVCDDCGCKISDPSMLRKAIRI